MNMLSFEEQDRHLQEVSRTFALTIPLFPRLLADCVANAYLLCRIADTVEDDPLCEPEQKRAWLADFARFCARQFTPESDLLNLTARGCRLVERGAKPAELELFHKLPEVVRRTLSYPAPYPSILSRGVAILSYGMSQSISSPQIRDLDDVDHYCYAVAGVVGETLACLFAAFEPRIDRERLLNLSVSFGEGLQLTNILKDRFTDRLRGASFLPPECFTDPEVFRRYLALTQGHLDDSLQFVKTVPRGQGGIRQFCLLNIVMASATLQQITQNPNQEHAKIDRRQVKKLYLMCKLCASSDWLTTWLFRSVSRNLTTELRQPDELRRKVSLWDRDLSSL